MFNNTKQSAYVYLIFSTLLKELKYSHKLQKWEKNADRRALSVNFKMFQVSTHSHKQSWILTEKQVGQHYAFIKTKPAQRTLQCWKSTNIVDQNRDKLLLTRPLSLLYRNHTGLHPTCKWHSLPLYPKECCVASIIIIIIIRFCHLTRYAPTYQYWSVYVHWEIYFTRYTIPSGWT